MIYFVYWCFVCFLSSELHSKYNKRVGRLRVCDISALNDLGGTGLLI